MLDILPPHAVAARATRPKNVSATTVPQANAELMSRPLDAVNNGTKVDTDTTIQGITTIIATKTTSESVIRSRRGHASLDASARRSHEDAAGLALPSNSNRNSNNSTVAARSMDRSILSQTTSAVVSTADSVSVSADLQPLDHNSNTTICCHSQQGTKKPKKKRTIVQGPPMSFERQKSSLATNATTIPHHASPMLLKHTKASSVANLTNVSHNSIKKDTNAKYNGHSNSLAMLRNDPRYAQSCSVLTDQHGHRIPAAAITTLHSAKPGTPIHPLDHGSGHHQTNIPEHTTTVPLHDVSEQTRPELAKVAAAVVANFSVINTRTNCAYKWQNHPHIIGALEVPYELGVNVTSDHAFTECCVVGQETKLRAVLRVWHELRLQENFVAACRTIPPRLACCGFMLDEDGTKKDVVRALKKAWVKPTNRRLVSEQRGFKLDVYLWTWHNAVGKSESHIILIRFFNTVRAKAATAVSATTASAVSAPVS